MKTVGRPGICPKPAGGAYSAPPDTLASAAGLAALSPKNHNTVSALKASDCGPSVLDNPSPIFLHFHLPSDATAHLTLFMAAL